MIRFLKLITFKSDNIKDLTGIIASDLDYPFLIEKDLIIKSFGGESYYKSMILIFIWI